MTGPGPPGKPLPVSEHLAGAAAAEARVSLAEARGQARAASALAHGRPPAARDPMSLERGLRRPLRVAGSSLAAASCTEALPQWQPAASLREPAAVQRGELCGFAYANGHWHSRSRDEGNDRAADPPLAVKLRLGMANKLVKGGNLFCVGQPWPSGL